MRVVLLTSNFHLGANVAVRTFLEHPALKKNDIEVVGIVSAATFALNRPGFKIMWRFLTSSGLSFFFKTVFVRTWQTLAMKFARVFVPNRNRKYFEVSELARQKKIPYLAVQRINSKEVLDFVKDHNPDYLVSGLLLQIVKKPLLEIPHLGAINFHPALTQRHRGSFTSFWTLLNRWHRSGATVHFMTEGLDSGKVILQRRFLIRRNDTLHCIDQRSARLGGILLAKALVKLQRKQKADLLIHQLGKVFSLPRVADVRRFEQMGKKIIQFRNLFDV